MYGPTKPWLLALLNAAASKLFTSRIQNVDKQSILRAVSNISGSHVDVQLPKLNLPCFGGGVREWTSF